MAEENPNVGLRKLALIGPLVIVAILALLVIAVILLPSDPKTKEDAGELEKVIITARVAPQQAVPQLLTDLKRADIVAAAEGAADEYSRSGAERIKYGSELIGRGFSIRIPFGCNAPAVGKPDEHASAKETDKPDSMKKPTKQAAKARDKQSAAKEPDNRVTEKVAEEQAVALQSPGDRTVRLVVQPAQLRDLPVIRSLPDAEAIESVSGFWLRRPWTTSEDCPRPVAALAGQEETPAAEKVFGLAQIFSVEHSRVGRHDEKPYEYLRAVPPDNPDLLSHSYRLLLEGRVTGFSTGEAIRCYSTSTWQRPVCLLAVEIQRVAFEDVQAAQSVAEWAQ